MEASAVDEIRFLCSTTHARTSLLVRQLEPLGESTGSTFILDDWLARTHGPHIFTVSIVLRLCASSAERCLNSPSIPSAFRFRRFLEATPRLSPVTGREHAAFAFALRGARTCGSVHLHFVETLASTCLPFFPVVSGLLSRGKASVPSPLLMLALSQIGFTASFGFSRLVDLIVPSLHRPQCPLGHRQQDAAGAVKIASLVRRRDRF